MIFLFKERPILSTIILLLFTLFLSSYFIWQLFKGEFSVLYLKDKTSHLNMLIDNFEKNNLDLIFYEKYLKALNPDHLDIDVLEEEMRKRMLFTKRNEILLLPTPHPPVLKQEMIIEEESVQ